MTGFDAQPRKQTSPTAKAACGAFTGRCGPLGGEQHGHGLQVNDLDHGRVIGDAGRVVQNFAAIGLGGAVVEGYENAVVPGVISFQSSVLTSHGVFFRCSSVGCLVHTRHLTL